MNGGLYSHDERTARKQERAEASFIETIVGRRGSLRSIFSQMEAVGGTNTTVLITEQTCTGKDIIARAICAQLAAKLKRVLHGTKSYHTNVSDTIRGRLLLFGLIAERMSW